MDGSDSKNKSKQTIAANAGKKIAFSRTDKVNFHAILPSIIFFSKASFPSVFRHF